MSFRSAILSVGLVALAWAPAPAQTAGLPPLSFLGFEPGVRLDALTVQARALGGRDIRCKQARRDPAVRECRAIVFDPLSGQAIALWVSAMDSAAGVLTLSGPVTAEQLDNWRSELETGFGQVGARVEGSQWMMQWVRRGTMLRLTWRIDHGVKVASVSLIDGAVLDGWGQRHSQEAPLRPPETSTPGAPDATPPGDSAPADSATGSLR